MITGHGAARILIINDDVGLRGALLAVLAANPRYSVQAATDAEDGRARIDAFRPQVVLLDLRMPGLNGVEFCRAVKGDPGTSATRILAMSALSEQHVREPMLGAGADAFLAKPFTLIQLEAEIERLLSIPPPAD